MTICCENQLSGGSENGLPLTHQKISKIVQETCYSQSYFLQEDLHRNVSRWVPQCPTITCSKTDCCTLMKVQKDIVLAMIPYQNTQDRWKIGEIWSELGGLHCVRSSLFYNPCRVITAIIFPL